MGSARLLSPLAGRSASLLFARAFERVLHGGTSAGVGAPQAGGHHLFCLERDREIFKERGGLLQVGFDICGAEASRLANFQTSWVNLRPQLFIHFSRSLRIIFSDL